MSKDIILVSSNKDKIIEVKNILKPLGFNVISLKDLNIETDIEETGETFEENALLKARFLKGKYPRIIADDSGLEIFSLNNQPGVYSARFLGEDTSYKVKNQIVIDMLKEKKDKGARFVSVIAYIHNEKEMTFRGEIVGEIVNEIKGDKGFGYDPIFMPKGYDLTFGQLDSALKDKISHRAQALLKLEEWLKNEKI
ncbi:MAG: RdgB/HAM1 family non-canonical purine NTP pyrophosphatase [Erysipelothrix sp.]|nr:RdgB/HAM1 family non-canonical purine NTP pyrophosphatase [Erysipelothrix sp.]